MFPRRTHLVLALVAALLAPAAASADTTFTFTGHGYGHGVGMGQYGAQGYALQGWTHEQILAHYYQGTTLGPSAVSQVRVLLQEKLPQATASAPAGLAAADEGGTATLAIPGPGAVTVRKDASGFTLARRGRRRARKRVDRARLADRERRRARDGRAARRSTRCATGATAGGCACSTTPAASRSSTSSRSRTTCAASSRARCRRTGSPRRCRRRRSRRAPTRSRRASRRPARSTSTRTSAARSTAASPSEGAAASAAVDATAGQVVLYQGQPIVTYFSSSSGGRTRGGAGGLLGREAGAVPHLGRRSLRHDLAVPRLDALAQRPRPLAEGDLPRASSPASTWTRTRPAASARVTLNGSAGPLELGAALARKRFGLRSTWFTVSPASAPPRAAEIALRARVVRNRVLLTGSAPPGTATLQGAAGYGWRDLVSREVARRRRRALLPPPGRRVVALPARRGLALDARRARHPASRACSCAGARAPG